MGQKIRCNRACGAADLHWRIVNGKYKLFGSDHLLHICKDGLRASYDMKKKATAIILNELDLNNVEDIPLADDYTKIQKKPKSNPNLKDFTRDDNYGEYDPAKMFTITSTASAPPTPIPIIPKPPALTLWLSVPIIIPPGKA